MTNDQLGAIEARLDAATPGPWIANPPDGPDGLYDHCWVGRDASRSGFQMYVAEVGTHAHGPADADLIAHAPTDLRALLAEVRRGRRIEGVNDAVARRRTRRGKSCSE